MQPSIMKTRCFCHFNSNYPSISIKTQKAANSWVVIDENTGENETFKIFNCGHAVHERCAKFVSRLGQEFHESITCPMCQIDWTRPSELLQLESAENQNPNIHYNDCICNEKVRVFKNQKNQWVPSITSYKAYPCGHGCHSKCHTLFWKFQKMQSEECPICAPKLEDREIIKLTHVIATSAELLTQQRHLMKTLIDKKKLESVAWDQKRYTIAIGALVAACVLIRFGHFATDVKTQIPLTKFTLGELIVCIIGVVISVFTAKLLARPSN